MVATITVEQLSRFSTEILKSQPVGASTEERITKLVLLLRPVDIKMKSR